MQIPKIVPKSLSCAVLAATLFTVLSMGVPAAWAQQPAQLDLLEPGFRAERFSECNGEMEKPIPGTGGIRQSRFRINGMECSPGGPWGDFVYMSLSRLEAGDAVTLLARTDFQGNSEPFAFATATNIVMQEIGFSPLDWREGNSLFVAIRTGPFSSTLDRFRPDASPDLIWINLSSDFILSAAVDPTGLFGEDVYFRQGGDIMRRDSAGDVSLFATLPPTSTNIREMRFGPGGPWGDDLYTAGLTIAPDGTATAFPGGFSEFDWAFGPGFDGDMFDLVPLGDGTTEIHRVKADGSRSLFATARDMSQVLSCNGALWIGGRGGCFAISEKQTGPNP